MLRLVLSAAIMVPVASAAQERPAVDAQAETGQPPQRIRSITLKKGEKCPQSSADEVVVCSSLDQPYRLPKGLRDRPIPAANQSWVNRAQTVDEVGRVAGGLPDTCSPVGTGGQSGCALATARAYAADKRAAVRDEASVP